MPPRFSQDRAGDTDADALLRIEVALEQANQEIRLMREEIRQMREEIRQAAIRRAAAGRRASAAVGAVGNHSQPLALVASSAALALMAIARSSRGRDGHAGDNVGSDDTLTTAAAALTYVALGAVGRRRGRRRRRRAGDNGSSDDSHVEHDLSPLAEGGGPHGPPDALSTPGGKRIRA